MKPQDEARKIFEGVKAGDPLEIALCDALRDAVPPLRRWNPNTSRMEPFKYTDEQRGNWYPSDAAPDLGEKK